jgi:regulator of protease activity HflC (stomatin/prohibitin superfamily)
MIHSLLDVLIPWIWLFFIIGSLYFFVRTAWQKGLWAAIKLIFSYRFFLPFLLAIGLTIFRASIVFIYPQEIGVVVSILSSNGIRDEPFKPGLHWIVPLFENVVVYPIYLQSYTMSAKPTEGQKLGDDSIVTRTADGQEVIIDCSLIFVVDPKQIIKLHIDWQDRYIEEFIRPALRAITRTHISQYRVDDINSNKRQEIRDSLEQTLINVTKGSGIIFQRFFLRNITFSKGYADAVEQKQMAEQGTIQKEHEALQMENFAKGEAARIRIRAEGEAAAILIKAKAEAKARIIQAKAEAEALELIAKAVDQQHDLLTYNYIDKLSPNLKAMILPHNAPLILPLPSLEPISPTKLPLPSLDAQPLSPTKPLATPAFPQFSTSTQSPVEQTPSSQAKPAPNRQ